MATQDSVNFWAQKAKLTNLCWSVCSTLLLFHSLPFLVIVALCVRVSGHRQIDLDFVGFRWRFRRRLVVIRVRQSVCVAVVIIRFAENVPEGFLSVKAWNAVVYKMRNVTLVSGALNLAHDPKNTKIRKKACKANVFQPIANANPCHLQKILLLSHTCTFLVQSPISIHKLKATYTHLRAMIMLLVSSFRLLMRMATLSPLAWAVWTRPFRSSQSTWLAIALQTIRIAWSTWEHQQQLAHSPCFKCRRSFQ